MDYQLTNFRSLRDRVLTQTPDLIQQQPCIGQTFYRTWINKAILLGISAPFVALIVSTAHRQPVASAFVSFIPIYALVVVLARDPLSVEISEEAIIIHYICRKLLIPFGVITDVSLRDTGDVVGERLGHCTN